MGERHRAFAGTPELHERHRPRLFAHAYSAISRRIRARCRCRCYPRRRFVLVFLVLVVVRALSFHICHENVLCRMRFVFRRQRRRVFFTLSNQFVFFFFLFLLRLLLFLFHFLSSKSFVMSSVHHHHHRIITYILYISVFVNVVSNGLWSLFLCKMKFMRFSKINFLVEKRSSHSQQHFAPSFLSHLHHSSLVVVAFDLFYREKETQRRGRRGEKVECR